MSLATAGYLGTGSVKRQETCPGVVVPNAVSPAFSLKLVRVIKTQRGVALERGYGFCRQLECAIDFSKISVLVVDEFSEDLGLQGWRCRDLLLRISGSSETGDLDDRGCGITLSIIASNEELLDECWQFLVVLISAVRDELF